TGELPQAAVGFGEGGGELRQLRGEVLRQLAREPLQAGRGRPKVEVEGRNGELARRCAVVLRDVADAVAAPLGDDVVAPGVEAAPIGEGGIEVVASAAGHV